MKTVSRSLSPGTVIHNRYQIRQELGAGGFGITYQVWDLKEQCIAAMKEFMPRDVAVRKSRSLVLEAKAGQLQNYERFQKKFLDEAQLIYQFRRHPNIVEVRHLFRENNTAYYVMEYLEGMDLGKLLKLWGQQVSWERLLPIFSQVVTALSAIHGSGLVHCDISPDNLYILKDGTVKLIDFGAAKNYIKGPSSIIYLKGKFAPPEQQMTNGKMGPWTDVYALAVVIYYAFTGKMPPESMERMISDRLILPSEMGMTIPGQRWEVALRKALELRPENRYHSVADFWRDMTGLECRQHPGTAGREQRQVQPEMTHGRNQRQVQPEMMHGRNQRQNNSSLAMECVRGCFAGCRITFEKETIFGTDDRKCQIRFPAGSPGISHVHMRCWSAEGRLMAMDLKSTYGTWLNRRQMTPGLVYTLSSGDVIQIGKQEIFRVL